MKNDLFIQWIDAELEKRNWTRADLAQKASMSQSHLSMIWGGTRSLNSDTIIAIANALGYSPEHLLKVAGILPTYPNDDPQLDELVNVFHQMTQEEKEEYVASGRLKVELRQKRENQGKIREPKTQPRPAQP